MFLIFALKHSLWVHDRTAEYIVCGYRIEPPQGGGCNEYPQSMFWSKNKKNMSTPANPSFTIKVMFKRVYISQICYRDEATRKGQHKT